MVGRRHPVRWIVFTVAVRVGDSYDNMGGASDGPRRGRRTVARGTVARGTVARRTVIGAVGMVGVSAVLTGCTWTGTTASTPQPPPDPLEPLRRSTHELVSHYRRVLDAHPRLAGMLAPLHTSHTAHLAALREVIDGPSPGANAPGGSPVPPATPPAGRSAPPGPAWAPGVSSPPAEIDVAAEPDAAVDDLRAAERRAFEEAVQACLDAAPERTAILGSICAARATHLEVLA
jgi:hypothetical protein